MNILETIHVPKDNANDDEVIITNIYVSNGEEVEEDTMLLDYETSKANFEIESGVSGFVTLLCDVGDTVRVGQEIIVIADEKGYQPKAEKSDSTKKAKQTFSKKAQEKIDEFKVDIQTFKNSHTYTHMHMYVVT